jgi:hypothetical protein
LAKQTSEKVAAPLFLDNGKKIHTSKEYFSYSDQTPSSPSRRSFPFGFSAKPINKLNIQKASLTIPFRVAFHVDEFLNITINVIHSLKVRSPFGLMLEAYHVVNAPYLFSILERNSLFHCMILQGENRFLVRLRDNRAVTRQLKRGLQKV